MSLTRAQSITILRRLGWRIRTTGEYRQAVSAFQGGYNLTARLAVDGVNGPRTQAALARSESNRRRGLPTASAHFSFVEFRCTCGGNYDNCRRILIVRKQLRNLEVYRRRVGHSVRVVSGYRCPGRNAELNGASKSRHKTGEGTDVNDGLSLATVQGLGVFNGIGYGARSGHVKHVDSRPVRVRPWRYPGW